ncbi:hypothetical protein F4827_005988 [Paraburkholderia bannensis]|uniref:Uncharacterized protein n=1 Tax=Paraburkholderia bannensis TaxID=765414 RepID=A0A7W9U336_9BURK|nr:MULTISPECIES: hypothetical protein [Paraburkholderia]MBB3261081.1 hypothetical protein [Paraburkholderia sp. WP4_3_2]MBB6106118.1 hypothetical protein [Paraburkholderia bannensis]
MGERLHLQPGFQDEYAGGNHCVARQWIVMLETRKLADATNFIAVDCDHSHRVPKFSVILDAYLDGARTHSRRR